MRKEPFIDYYEILQLSPNADTDTIERVFRHLAKRYHPDNARTGDAERFDLLVKAHRALMDPEKRAAYDVQHQENRDLRWRLVEEAEDADGFESVRTVRERLLSLLYAKRRRDVNNPGIGSLELERILGYPREHLDFHVWYLREKKWIERTDSGFLAITADGVDQVEAGRRRLRRDRLLEDRATQPDSEPEKLSGWGRDTPAGRPAT